VSGPELRKPPASRGGIEDEVLHLIDLALSEDRGPGDWTSRWIVPPRARIRCQIIARAQGVIAGLAPALAVFRRVDGRIETNVLAADGEPVSDGVVLCELKGPGRNVLTAERVGLNFLQRLSGIATLTRKFVDAIGGTNAKILDTRKTTPGWRSLEKAAVRAGGGINHRQGLFDAVLVKDNHIAIAGGVKEALLRIREHNARGLPVIVEIASLADLDAALSAGVDRVLLDNLDLETTREAVKRVHKRARKTEIEASGNMTLDRVRAVAETGVDFISVGAITHSAPALDVSMEVIRP
jgi:nicotinate-nucleotide pyrophosphorylase (carboxylating)